MRYILPLLCIASVLLASPALAEVPDSFSPSQYPEPVEMTPFESLLGYTVSYDESKVLISPAEQLDEMDVFTPAEDTVKGTALTIFWQEAGDLSQAETVAALEAALEEEGYTVIPFDPGTLFDEAFEAKGLSGLKGDDVTEAFVLKAEEGYYTLAVRYAMDDEAPYGQRLYGIVESFALTREQEAAE